MRLTLTLESSGGNNAGFAIPESVVDELGSGRRPKVVTTVNGYSWRSSIAFMGGRFLLGMNKENRTGAGVAAGDVVDVEILLDQTPRTVEAPEDLAGALAADPEADAVWQGWSYTKQKEAARQLTEAKQAETRARRLAKVLGQLTAG